MNLSDSLQGHPRVLARVPKVFEKPSNACIIDPNNGAAS